MTRIVPWCSFESVCCARCRWIEIAARATVCQSDCGTAIERCVCVCVCVCLTMVGMDPEREVNSMREYNSIVMQWGAEQSKRGSMVRWKRGSDEARLKFTFQLDRLDARLFCCLLLLLSFFLFAIKIATCSSAPVPLDAVGLASKKLMWFHVVNSAFDSANALSHFHAPCIKDLDSFVLP